MIENTNQNITVIMTGNPDAQSGESMLLNINNSPLKSGELGKSYYDYITSDYYIELKHGTEYITYTYVMNPAKVHSQGANRPGVFWIGVTIPRGKQIENPYDLIIELRDKFQELYMTQLSDGSYEFINVPYKADVFKNIVDKYELVGLQSSYVEMTGTKMQTLSLKSDNVDGSAETKIRKFFDDTQYPELEEYSSVIVAEGIDGVTSIPIEVPRLIVYKVKEKVGIKDKELGKISRKEPQFEYTLRKTYHKNINVKFSLDDLNSAKENVLQLEDNGSKYKVEKNKETITISVDKWVPEEKQIGVIIKGQDEPKWENYFKSMKLTVNEDEKNISYNKDFGYYITLIGEEIDGKIEVIQKKTDDIYNYVKTSRSDSTIIEIEVIEFNKIILSGVPCDEKNKKLVLNIEGEKEPVPIEIVTTHNGGMYDIEIAKHDDLKNLTQFDIKSYKYESETRYTDESDLTISKQYDKTKGVLEIKLEGFKDKSKASDNKQTDGNIPNQQTVSDEQTADDKCTFIVYNEIKESTITLNKLCVNDKGKNLLENSLEIKNTKGVNGNKPQNYKEIENIDKLKEFSIKFKLKKIEGGNFKVKDNDVAVIVIENQDIEVHIKFKNDLTEDDKKAQVRYAIQNKDTKEFEVTIEEANNKDNKNNLFARIKDSISKILKRKADETENSKPEVEDAKTEDVANVDKPKNSKLRFVFRCLLFWLISLIIAFVFGLIVENQRHVLPLKNIFKNNTRSEKSVGRFGCSRKAAEEKEKFEKQVKEYLELLQNCTEDLNFETVTYIKQYCDSFDSINKADPRNNYISDAEEDPFNKLNNYIAVFSDVAGIIKSKKITGLSGQIPSDDDFYKKLKNNLKPLLPCNDENDAACKKYTTFVSLIKDGTIDISKIKSFADVLKLYEEEKTQELINKMIGKEKAELLANKLRGECDGYYSLMKKCGDNFTFDEVNTIYSWVEDNKTDSLIKDYVNFKTIQRYIPYYKAAADAIRKIDSNWLTTDWFVSDNSKVLYDCFMKNTPRDGFNDNFRACIVHLLGGNSTGSPEEGKGAESINIGQIYEVGFKKNVGKISDEINHTKNYSTEKKYLIVNEKLYKDIDKVLQNAGKIKSFRDLKNIKTNNP